MAAGNRYGDILLVMPKGGYYPTEGTVVPHRDSPYALRFQTTSHGTTWAIYLNNSFKGLTVTDNVTGVATINLLLAKGVNDIVLTEQGTNTSVSTSMTTTDWATWAAAQAEQITTIDDNNELVLADSNLATCEIQSLESIWGKTVDIPNIFGYSGETYRDVIQEVRQAYRPYGGLMAGVEQGVATITQIRPMQFSRVSMGPDWFLGVDLLDNSDLQAFTRTIYSNLPTINAGGAGLSVIFSSTEPITIGNTTVTTATAGGFRNISWTLPTGESNSITIAASAFLQLGSIPVTRIIKAVLKSVTAGPFTLPNSDGRLILEIDDLGPLSITVVGASVSVATLVGVINTAFSSDPRYGAPYNAVASADANGLLSISSVVNGAAGSIVIHLLTGNGTTDSLSEIVFDVPYNRATLNGPATAGDTVISVNAATPWRLPLPDNLHESSVPMRIGRNSSDTMEIVNCTIASIGAHNITISPGLAYNHASGIQVETVVSAPLRITGHTAIFTMTFTVNNSSLLGNHSDTVPLLGSIAPDGWIVQRADVAVDSFAYAAPYRTRLTKQAMQSDFVMYRRASTRALAYRGFQFTARAWVTNTSASAGTVFVGMSFDGGATWIEHSNVVLAGLTHRYRPFMVFGTFTMPATATNCHVRIRCPDTDLIVEQVRLEQNSDTAAWLGHNTIPRNEQRARQGYFTYIWSPVALTTNEANTLGLQSVTGQGLIDTLEPAHMWLERFNVSEYDGFGNPVNVKGSFTSSDFAAGTSINMEPVLRSPSKFSHLVPSKISLNVDTITFDPITHLANLSTPSTQNLNKAILYENDVPITQDEWSFTSATQIHATGFTPSQLNTYKFEYEVLIQYTTPVIDMGVGWATYLWFADWYNYSRSKMLTITDTIKVGVQFDSNNKFILPQASDQNTNTSTLIRDTGVSKSTVSSNQWQYVDSQTISISGPAFDSNSIYTFTYTALAMYPSAQVAATCYVRTDSDATAILSDPWTQVAYNAPIPNPNRYSQLKIVFTNIEDVRDLRLQSLLLKGLNMTSGATPVLS